LWPPQVSGPYIFPNMKLSFNISFLEKFFRRYSIWLIFGLLVSVSIFSFVIYLNNGLGLAYNDARSHLDIGRRVVEGLKPGLAQLGSVWLPLPHALMIPTIWNDFMWHTGLAGALVSMISFVATGIIIFKFLEKLGVGMAGRWTGVLLFVANINILYLQSTAMTELLLLATMTIGSFYLLVWHQDDHILDLIKASFWIMLSTLVRYDGWFLLFLSTCLVVLHVFRRKGYKMTEGITILFVTVGALGIGMWLLWNQLIFGDPLYFAFGPYSAHAQQEQLDVAGILVTKHNWAESFRIYMYALVYNSGAFTAVLGLIGAVGLWLSKRLSVPTRVASIALLAPLFFNILALYLGHSVLFVQGLSGDTWFNVRYGVMLVPSIAIYIGFLIDRAKGLRFTLVGLLMFVTFFAFINNDAVTIDDAQVGSSQKNVSEVSGYLNTHAKDEKGFIMISAASHDAIIFSSGLPMKRFIHEGTGAYWDSASVTPDRWARWLVMRTNDPNDSTFKAVANTPGLARYHLVAAYPFADVYELDEQYLGELITDPIFGKQK
jgi:hypothetical protein